jgi:hypothetical protein
MPQDNAAYPPGFPERYSSRSINPCQRQQPCRVDFPGVGAINPLYTLMSNFLPIAGVLVALGDKVQNFLRHGFVVSGVDQNPFTLS